MPENDQTPERVVEGTPDAMFTINLQTQVFETAQTLGAIDEKVSEQSNKITELQAGQESIQESIQDIARQFGYIKKAWWVLLVLAGYVLNSILQWVASLVPQ